MFKNFGALLESVARAITGSGTGRIRELAQRFSVKGGAPNINNVELGKRGRWRSNLWTYPGASSLGSDARRGLQDHPTVKPVAMLEDALLDLTNIGDLVLDPFLGSGSTLMACTKTGRICRGLEVDPLYTDVIIRRFEAVTGVPTVLAETGERFVDLAARRLREQADAQGGVDAGLCAGADAGSVGKNLDDARNPLIRAMSNFARPSADPGPRGRRSALGVLWSPAIVPLGDTLPRSQPRPR